jgi:hypothetical protein
MTVRILLLENRFQNSSKKFLPILVDKFSKLGISIKNIKNISIKI